MLANSALESGGGLPLEKIDSILDGNPVEAFRQLLFQFKFCGGTWQP